VRDLELLNSIKNFFSIGSVSKTGTGFLKLVSLINRLNKPISESLLSKLSQLSTIPYVEFEVYPSINKVENLNPF
jgi:hypothetical protein